MSDGEINSEFGKFEEASRAMWKNGGKKIKRKKK